jgi:hypothetical protein
VLACSPGKGGCMLDMILRWRLKASRFRPVYAACPSCATLFLKKNKKRNTCARRLCVNAVKCWHLLPKTAYP